LVITQVNALFEREPSIQLLRTDDGKARAFLSDRFNRLDNDALLEQILPPIVKGEIQSKLLSSNVSDDYMHLKILFTDPRLAMDLGDAPHGRGRDIVHPGAAIDNSETGRGKMKVRGFLYRRYCENGCVFGSESVFDYTRTHLGPKLNVIEGSCYEVFSDETIRKQNELIICEATDAMKALSKPENVAKMRDALVAAKNDTPVTDAFAAVTQLARELPIRDSEKQSILESFLQDGDFTRWGMLNAVTSVANSDAVTYDRACELEEIGGEIIDLNSSQWQRIATATLREKIAA
jgi:hypothetical protein